MIQCARLAFGFTGIFDTDEAERIIESSQPMKAIDPATGEIIEPAKPVRTLSAERFTKALSAIAEGTCTAQKLEAFHLTLEQESLLEAELIRMAGGEEEVFNA